jgi:hypothetical protein
MLIDGILKLHEKVQGQTFAQQRSGMPAALPMFDGAQATSAPRSASDLTRLGG